MKYCNLLKVETSETGHIEEQNLDKNVLTLIIEFILSSNFSSIAPSIINKFEMLERTLPSRHGRFRFAPSSLRRWNAKCLAATERTLSEKFKINI